MSKPLTLGVVLAALLLARPAHAALAADTFKDVPAGHWAEAGIGEVAVKRDLMRGYPDGTFQGDRPFTRYQFAESLLSLVKELEDFSHVSWRPTERPLNTYADVPPGPTRDALLALANDYALFEGVPGLTPERFAGDRTVTRFEMAKVIANLMRLAEAKDVVRPRGTVQDTLPFKDVDRSAWLWRDLQDVSQRYRVMVGFPDATFRGTEELTRYQYAQAISQTVPLIRQLITETIEIKREEERQARGAWRWQEREPYHLDLTTGITGGTSAGKMTSALTGRYVGYPGQLMWLSDTRLQLESGALAGTTAGGGVALDEVLMGMIQVPLLGPVQLQPLLGARMLLDLAPTGQNYLFAGPGAGAIAYWRPEGTAWGFRGRLGYASMLLGSSLSGAASPAPAGLGLWQGELAAEYHLASWWNLEAGVGYWEAPSGYLTGAATGRASHTGLMFGASCTF